ncbi:MAG: imidazolonepropionase [Bdellovibrionota bacterium]
MPRILYSDITELVTNAGVARKQGVGITTEDLGIFNDGALLWDSSKGILWLGETKEIPKTLVRGAKRIRLKGKTLMPALVDCHTHLAFAGSRHHEFAMRLAGSTYQQIAAAGGGIKNSVAATREISEQDLFKLACERVESYLALGVGVLEIKSGYGLDWENERKQLRVAQKLKRKYANKITFQTTFLGAHAFPPGTLTAQQRNAYVDKVVDEMLPQVAKQNLADACDVFFDEGYFDLEQSRRLLKAAQKLGLKIKLHADELADVGGAALAAELGALSADHLLKANDNGLRAMAEAGVVAVLLPSTALFLGIGYPPVERMRRAGLCFALSTDFNPGSSPTLHLPFILSLACLQMGFTMPEAFAAATFGGARALGMQATQGHLRVGAKPRIAILDCPSYQALISQMAHPGLAEAVF